MFVHLLALAGDRTPATPLPQSSALTIMPNAGYCTLDAVGEHATLTLNFAVTNPDSAYELHLLESGSLLDTLPITATSYVYTTPGDVENAGASQQAYTFDFTLQVVRIADGVVLQEENASYTSTYGTCR